MRRLVTALLSAVLIGVIVIPVSATAEGHHAVYEEFGVSGEFGNMYSARGEDPAFDQFQIFVTGPDAFQCSAYGEDAPMPEFHRLGIDRAVASITAPSSQFDCQGTPPETITFDVEILADYVEKVTRSENRTILKGEGVPQSLQFQTVYAGGTATGEVQGEALTGFVTGFFGNHSSNDGGPPPPTIAP